MEQSRRTQHQNVDNYYQGPDKRVLAVCSAGLLRSPTIANVLHTEYGYNVRACGTDMDYALVPVSTALLAWADLVVFANRENYNEVKAYLKPDCEYVVLDLPDDYGYNDPVLVNLVKRKLKELLVNVA